MASIHTHRSFSAARNRGAWAAHSLERWTLLTDLSKRELAELVVQFAARTSDDAADVAITRDGDMLDIIRAEIDALRNAGLI